MDAGMVAQTRPRGWYVILSCLVRYEDVMDRQAQDDCRRMRCNRRWIARVISDYIIRGIGRVLAEKAVLMSVPEQSRKSCSTQNDRQTDRHSSTSHPNQPWHHSDPFSLSLPSLARRCGRSWRRLKVSPAAESGHPFPDRSRVRYGTSPPSYEPN